MPFDPNQLAGAIGGMNPNGGNAFMRGWQRAQQELQQRKQLEQQAAQQQQHGAMQQEQLGFQRDANTRANQDQTLQRQAQQVQAVNSLRTLLGDESIDDPAVFDERMNFASNLAPTMGVDPGFLQTLRPTPDTFTKRKLKKLLGTHEKRTAGEREQFEASGVWRVGDQSYTPAQARAALGTGGVNVKTGESFSFQKAPSAADSPSAGSFEEYVNLPPDKQALRRQQRKEFQQADDRPQPQATVLIQTVDENGKPVQRFVSKQPGSEFASAPTAGQQTAMAEQEASLTLMGDIDRMFKPEYVGPMQGRATRVQMSMPGAPDVAPEVAEFYSSVAGLRNEIIKLMSGAAVSGSEERRMRDQLPDVTDKPSVFAAKMNATRRNREALLQRMQARSGGTASPMQPMPSHGQPKAPVKIGRFDVTVND